MSMHDGCSLGGRMQATFAVVNISNQLFPLTQAQQSGDFGGYACTMSCHQALALIGLCRLVQFEALSAVEIADMTSAQRQRARSNPNSQAGTLKDHMHHVVFGGANAMVGSSSSLLFFVLGGSY